MELRRLSDRFNRIEGTPEGDYFSAANLEPYFAHHGWAQAHALAAIMAETPSAFEGVRRVWDLGGGPRRESRHHPRDPVGGLRNGPAPLAAMAVHGRYGVAAKHRGRNAKTEPMPSGVSTV